MRVRREVAEGSAEFRRLPERVWPREMAEARPVGVQDTEWQLRAGGLG